MRAISNSVSFLWGATLLLVCAAAFLVIALISLGIFERVPHVEDEAAYLFQAQVFAQGRLSVSTPPYPESYWSPFVVDFQGQRFGKYPPGYPLLLSLGVRLGRPWIVNALLAALSLWFLAQLGRVIYSPTTGLIAAALGLTCPVFLAESGTLLSHTASFFLTVVFLWAFANLIEVPGGQHNRQAVVAGLALGFLLITRPYDALGVGLPFGLYALAHILHGNRRLLRHGVMVVGIALIFGLMLLVYWRLLTGQFVNAYRLVWPYDRPGFGPEIGVNGYTLQTGFFLTRLNLRALSRGWLGWPGYLNIVLLWAPFLLRPRDRWNYLLLAGFVSVVTVHITYWYYGGHDAGFPRYYYAALPMLLLLTARGIELVAGSLRSLASRVWPPAKMRAFQISAGCVTLALYGAVVALVVYNVVAFLPDNLRAFQGKYGITAAPLRAVREAGITGALVFVTPYETWRDFAIFFAANSPTLDSDVVYAIYRDKTQAQAVKALYAGRQCYVQRRDRLTPCSF